MTINTSKIIMGTAIVAVALLLFASVPAAAESNKITETIEVKQGTDDTTHEEWKWENNELTINGDLQIAELTMNLDKGITAKIHINGTFTVDSEDDYSQLTILTNGSDCVIDGNGNLVSAGGLIMENNDGANHPTLTVDGISLDTHGCQDDNGIRAKNADVVIKNCPEVKVRDSVSSIPIDISEGKITFQKTYVCVTSHSIYESMMISATDGIFMDGNPTGLKVFYKTGETRTDKFVSGETTSIWNEESTFEGEVFTLEMDSYSASDEPSAENNLLMKVAVVGCSLIAIVCFGYALFARK